MRLSDFLVKALNKSVEIIGSISNDISGACEKGDCLINNDTLYYNCSGNDCPRMKAAKDSSCGEIVDVCLWPYMKRLEQIQNKKGCQPETEADFVYDLAKKYMPKYIPFLDIIGLNFVSCGIACSNTFFCLLWDLREEDISWTRHQLERLVSCEIGSVELHLQYNFYRNLSLYNRDGIDFDYTVKIFEIISDPEQRAKVYIDSAEISISSFFDENGDIKPAGVGGEEKGFVGDTIWNVVVSWEKLEKDKRFFE